MTIDDYLAALDDKLQEIAGLVSATTVQRELDVNTGIGLIKGTISFVDGSRLEFTEQLPTERCKFRLHYMDATKNLIARWDSAPHHKELSTFPFHKHTQRGIEAHNAMTVLDALDEITRILKI